MTPNECDVHPHGRVGCKLLEQRIDSLLGSSDHKQPGTSCVKPMNDAWSSRLAYRGNIRVPRQEPVDERGIGISRTRVDHKACRLVDD